MGKCLLDEVFSFKNTYGYFWWQGQKGSFSALLPLLRESIQFESLYLHKRCVPRIDNGLKDSKISSTMAINSIFTGKTCGHKKALWTAKNLGLAWSFLALKTLRGKKFPYNQLRADSNSGKPKKPRMAVLQLPDDLVLLC